MVQTIEPIPLHIRRPTDEPICSGAMAWSADQNSLFVVVGAALNGDLHLRVYGVPLKEQDASLLVSESEPELLQERSVRSEELKRRGLEAVVTTARVEGNALDTLLRAKDDEKGKQDEVLRLALESKTWRDVERAE